MRDGDLPLEEAVTLFEEGISLAKGLEKDIGKVERKIEMLVNQPEIGKAEPALELFPELDNSGSAKDSQEA